MCRSAFHSLCRRITSFSANPLSLLLRTLHLVSAHVNVRIRACEMNRPCQSPNQYKTKPSSDLTLHEPDWLLEGQALTPLWFAGEGVQGGAGIHRDVKHPPVALPEYTHLLFSICYCWFSNDVEYSTESKHHLCQFFRWFVNSTRHWHTTYH